ncbi:MAG: PKD domain-containing protein, partial [Bacteroidales bacterium]|nr:PKD domain-containing protein [Bacteroidales bacterium]
DYLKISRGTEEGELYFLNRDHQDLYYSNDFGITWVKQNTMNTTHKFDDITGGRQDGEMYMTLRFNSMGWQNAQIYVLHSTDYGITFDVHCPFTKGQEPLSGNFSAKTPGEISYMESDDPTIDSIYYVTGDMPLDVQFYNYSMGDIIQYEWDFDNDGTIDSFEESPVYTYQDTGYYSVRLIITDTVGSNSFFREDYIHVKHLVGMEEENKAPIINCYPNPFKETIQIAIEGAGNIAGKEIKILDINGSCVKRLPISGKKITWDGSISDGTKAETGTYFVLINSEKPIIKKILLIH